MSAPSHLQIARLVLSHYPAHHPWHEHSLFYVCDPDDLYEERAMFWSLYVHKGEDWWRPRKECFIAGVVIEAYEEAGVTHFTADDVRSVIYLLKAKTYDCEVITARIRERHDRELPKQEVVLTPIRERNERELAEFKARFQAKYGAPLPTRIFE